MRHIGNGVRDIVWSYVLSNDQYYVTGLSFSLIDINKRFTWAILQLQAEENRGRLLF
jgi:hypothetical protein